MREDWLIGNIVLINHNHTVTKVVWAMVMAPHENRAVPLPRWHAQHQTQQLMGVTPGGTGYTTCV